MDGDAPDSTDPITLARQVVEDGIKLARAELVLVMDADFQHPPSLAPVLYRRLQDGGADVVIASRYVAGGDPRGLTGILRRVGSRAAAVLGTEPSHLIGVGAVTV